MYKGARRIIFMVCSTRSSILVRKQINNRLDCLKLFSNAYYCLGRGQSGDSLQWFTNMFNWTLHKTQMTPSIFVEILTIHSLDNGTCTVAISIGYKVLFSVYQCLKKWPPFTSLDKLEKI